MLSRRKLFLLMAVCSLSVIFSLISHADVSNNQKNNESTDLELGVFSFSNEEIPVSERNLIKSQDGSNCRVQLFNGKRKEHRVWNDILTALSKTHEGPNRCFYEFKSKEGSCAAKSIPKQSCKAVSAVRSFENKDSMMPNDLVLSLSGCSISAVYCDDHNRAVKSIDDVKRILGDAFTVTTMGNPESLKESSNERYKKSPQQFPLYAQDKMKKQGGIMDLLGNPSPTPVRKCTGPCKTFNASN